MGDLLEFTTSPYDVRNLYTITSGALKFYLKGTGNAVIRLACEPSESYLHEIIIGNQYSWIGNDRSKVKTINIISEHTYRPFWISWYGKIMRIGKGDNSKPFLVKNIHRCPLSDTVNYISFSSQEHHTMYWKFRLPPKIKDPIYKTINDGQLKWVKMNGNCLPEDAIIGGFENEVLYIMRAMHEEALIPGKFVPSEGAGYVVWGYETHKKTDMEILCGHDCMWIKSQDCKIPQGALEGGYTEVNPKNVLKILYVGRAKYNRCLIPGKVQRSQRACYFAYEGLITFNTFYEILVVPPK